jgi:hypothetical protein
MDHVKAILKEHLSENEFNALPNELNEFVRIVKAALITNATTAGASVDKGKRGEKYVRDVLCKYNPVASMRNHAGDIIVNKVCVEVKDYTNQVPKGEIDKFLKDLASKDAPAGLFISLSSPITGMGSLTHTTEIINGHKIPVMYVVGDSPETIQLATELLLTEISTRQFTTLDCTIKEEFLDRIELAYDSLRNLKDARDALTRLLNTTTNTLQHVQFSIMTSESTIRANLEAIRGDIKVQQVEEIVSSLDLDRFKHIHNKEGVEKIIAKLDAVLPSINWKSMTTKADKGVYSIHFSKNFTQFSVPLDHIDKSKLSDLLAAGMKCTTKRCMFDVVHHENIIVSLIV